MSTPFNILVEVSPLSGSTPVTLRLASRDADEVAVTANGEQWLPCINGLPKLSAAFADNGLLGETAVSRGEVGFIINKKHGTEDFNLYDWSGAFCQIWVGPKGGDWSTYAKYFEGQVSPLEQEGINANFKLFGPEAELTNTILTLEYAGTGGAEGPAELKGTPKPRCYGSPRSVEPVEIDPINLIYQVHAYGAVQSITPYEYGSPLLPSQNVGDQATYNALAALDLTPGQYATCLAKGLMRFGGTPTPKISADVVMASGNSVAEIAEAVMLDAGIAAQSIGDFSDFDSVETDLFLTEETPALDVLLKMFKDAGGYLVADSNAVWQAGLYYESTRTASTLNSDQSSFPLVLEWKQDPTTAPLWRVKYGYERCWGVHSDSDASPLINELAGGLLAATDAANNAQNTADAAQASANNANTAIQSFTADNKLDSSEKKRIVTIMAEYAARKPLDEAQADQFGITTEKTTYQNKYNALVSYLNGLSPAYTDFTQSTSIVRATFNTRFSEYTDAQVKLLNKIAERARIVWRGAYDAGTTYTKNDGVTYNGRSFVSLVNSNTGNTPPNSATNNTFWQLVADKGDTGADGAPGQDGKTALGWTPVLTTGTVQTTDGFVVQTSQGVWADSVHSQEKFYQARVSFELTDLTPQMIGLNTDPALDADFNSIDFAVYLHPDGVVRARRNGKGVAVNDGNETAAVGDVFAVAHEGNDVVIYKNGTEIHRWVDELSKTVPMALDTSFHPDVEIKNVNFTQNGVAGDDAIVGYLTNEAHIVPASSEGVVSDFSGATGDFVVFSGVHDVSSLFTLSTLTNPKNVTVTYTDQTYAVSGGMSGDDTATLTIRATGSGVFGGVVVDKKFTISKSKAGKAGLKGDQGDTGATGDAGPQGPAGEDGQTLYTWIAYANNALGTSGFTTGQNTGQTYIGIANNKTTATESTNPADYTWSLIKGNDGVPGTPGANGQPTYTWFAYASNADGSENFTTGTPVEGTHTYIGIAANKDTATESNNPADYTWSLIKGADAPLLTLSSTHYVFPYNENDNPKTQEATISVQRQNLSDTPVWKLYTEDGTERAFSETQHIAITADQLSANVSNFRFRNFIDEFGGESMRIEVTAGGLTDSLTLTKVRDGATGQDGVDGINGEDGIYREFVWKRASTQPATPVGDGIPSGWTDEPLAGSDPLWMSVAKQELDGTLLSGEVWSTPIRHDGPKGEDGQDGQEGEEGAKTAAVLIYARSFNQPSTPSTTATFTFATGVLTNANNGWSTQFPSTSGDLSSIWVSRANAQSKGSTDTIAPADWSTPTRAFGGLSNLDQLDFGNDDIFINRTFDRLGGTISTAQANSSGLMRYNGGGLFQGDLTATAGATWGTNIAGRPNNLAALNGYEPLDLSNLRINTKGQINTGQGVSAYMTVGENLNINPKLLGDGDVPDEYRFHHTAIHDFVKSGDLNFIRLKDHTFVLPAAFDDEEKRIPVVEGQRIYLSALARAATSNNTRCFFQLRVFKGDGSFENQNFFMYPSVSSNFQRFSGFSLAPCDGQLAVIFRSVAATETDYIDMTDITFSYVEVGASDGARAGQNVYRSDGTIAVDDDLRAPSLSQNGQLTIGAINYGAVTARGIGVGELGFLNAINFGDERITNKTAQHIEPYGTRRWAAEDGADVTAKVDGPISARFNHSASGTAENGQFPRNLSYRLLYQNGFVQSTGVTWTYRVVGGVVNGHSPSATYRSMSGTGTGTLAISSLGADTSSVIVRAVIGGKTQEQTVTLSKTYAAPETGGGSGGGSNGSSRASQTSGFGSFNSSAWTVVAGPLAVTAGSTTLTNTVNLSAEMPFGTNGARQILAKVQRKINGTWTDEGQSASATTFGETDPEIGYISSPANFQFERTTTVSAGSEQECRVLMRIGNGGNVTMTIGGNSYQLSS
ncbi:hypothetical protein PF049_00220 [Erythrobacteraceae bacterium WH01K]|nr:hypothetical protein PF049_00220 [Erythrobacteraceae bacterium WH01K]